MIIPSPLRSAPFLMALVLLCACQPTAEKRAEGEGARDAEADPHAGIDLPPGHPAVLPGDGVAAQGGASAHPPVISLDGEGLRLVDPKSGATRPVGFGMPEDQLLPIAEKLKGPAEKGRAEECGAGPLSFLRWSDGLTLYSLDGLFAGWSLDETGTPAAAKAKGKPAPRLTTISGIGIGSTRAQLLDVYDAKIEQTTLGTEFNTAGLSGILEGTGGKARVTNMWSGVNCVFR
ncbi:hypothetical protein [Blastomonas sp. AAP53]|uniref:hypothetical protein n=1 Tax=Blastomonas sp. AAP53 TaxID=1248760 RepID=UPI0002D9A2F5|nr:hypothetical protein [Blastomonas sp. AAP53]